MKSEIYLDYSATTPVSNSVRAKVSEFLDSFANPSSIHKLGKELREKVGAARKKIAESINAKESQIIFTSGGTESNNLAIRGLAKKFPEKRHIITSKIEHPSVLEPCKSLEKEGYTVDYIGVDSEGIVLIDEIKKRIRKDSLLVSIMHANNEIGTIQPIEEISKICLEKGVFFHTDAVQSYQKQEIDVEKLGLNLASFSGHKIGALKGIGFLFVEKPNLLSPILYGGGQEFGLRSGTQNTTGIFSISAALDEKIPKADILSSREKLIEGILKIPRTRLNGSRKHRLFNNINVSFYGIEAEALTERLSRDGIYISTGSACASTKLEESHVLRAIGLDDLYLHGSIRISLGRPLNDEEIDFILAKIGKNVEELRKLSPFN